MPVQKVWKQIKCTTYVCVHVKHSYIYIYIYIYIYTNKEKLTHTKDYIYRYIGFICIIFFINFMYGIGLLHKVT